MIKKRLPKNIHFTPYCKGQPKFSCLRILADPDKRLIESIPLEVAQKHSTGSRSKAFHWKSLKNIPLEFAQQHSTGSRSKVFHWKSLKSIPLEVAQKHSTGNRSQKHSTGSRSKAFQRLYLDSMDITKQINPLNCSQKTQGRRCLGLWPHSMNPPPPSVEVQGVSDYVCIKTKFFPKSCAKFLDPPL